MYLEIDEGFMGHRKTLRMCALMGNECAAVYLLRLWTWACRSCKTGDLTGVTSAELEMAVQYHPADGRCYDALAASGYIDTDSDGNPALIHNWMHYTGASLRRMEEKAAENRQRRADAKAKSDSRKRRKRTGIVPESYQHDGASVLTKTRQDKTSPDKASGLGWVPSPTLEASGSGATPVPMTRRRY